MTTSAEQALEELYAGSPATFTTTRDRLAKELRASGDAEGAAEIAARHRPTQIAHVLNQLARRHADALAELVDVGRELARVQRGVLRGGSASGLREAIERQRKVVSDLTSKAATVMRDLGVDPHDHLDEIASALRAALVDPAVGEALERGRLEKTPAQAAGFPGAAVHAAEPEPKRGAAERHEAKRSAAEERKAAKRTAAEARRDAAQRAAEEKRRRAKERAHAKQSEAETRRREKEQRVEAKHGAAEARRREKEERVEAKRRAAESAKVERARHAEEARERAIAEAESAEREAEAAVAAASARAEDAARARDEAARLAKEARALAADAKRRTASAKRARAHAAALGTKARTKRRGR